MTKFLAALLILAFASDLGRADDPRLIPPYMKNASAIMESADFAAIFAVEHDKDGPIHPLSDQARKELVAIIDQPANFPNVLNFSIGSADYGIVFRKGGTRFTLYTYGFSYFFTDPRKGGDVIAVLDDTSRIRAQAWARKYLPKYGLPLPEN